MKKSISIFVLLTIAITASVYSQDAQNDLWKHKVLYLGGSFGMGPIFGPDGLALGGNLNPVQLDWQITDFLSLGTGLNFYFGPQTRHTALKQTDPASGLYETYSGIESHIVFPLLLEYTYRPGIFSFEIGGGVYAAPVTMNTMVERTNENGFTTAEAYGKNLFSAKNDNPFGFIVSSSFGVKAGQGILFLDVRYLRDFSEVTFKFNDVKLGSHLWHTLGINIGYKFGLINSK